MTEETFCKGRQLIKMKEIAWGACRIQGSSLELFTENSGRRELREVVRS